MQSMVKSHFSFQDTNCPLEKHWFPYVLSFAFKSLNFSSLHTCSSTTLKCVLQLQKKLSESFTLHRDSVFFLGQNISRLPAATGTVLMEFSIKQFQFVSKGSSVSHISAYYGHAIQFQIYHNLGLNLSIHELYFASGEDCMKGNISVFHGFVSFNETFGHNASLFFCGQHSTLSVFPGVSKLQISIFVHLVVVFLANATFSVVDLRAAQSFLTTSHHSPLQSHIKYSSNKTIMVYMITTKKNCFIELIDCISASHNTTVHDGPRFQSKPVTPTKSVYKTTSFQSVAKISVLQGNVKTNETFNLNSHPVQIAQNITIGENTTTSAIPTADSHSSPFVVFLAGAFNFSLNVTVINMRFKGDNKTCRFGGLVAVETSRHGYHESFALCADGDFSSL